MPEKREASPEGVAPGEGDSTALVPVPKRPRTELVAADDPKQRQIAEAVSLFHLFWRRTEAPMMFSLFQGPPRTSNLESPIMLLTGHSGEIYSAKFHPEGQFLISSGFDRQICEFYAMNPKISLIYRYVIFSQSSGTCTASATTST